MKNIKLKSIVSFLTTLAYGILFGALITPLFGQNAGIAVATLVTGSHFMPKTAGVLGMNNMDARMIYENSKVALRKAFPDVSNIAEICKLTQSTYRFEQPLVAGTTLYTFNVLTNQAVFSNTEKRLLQQDSAVVYSLGIFVAAPASPTDTAFTLDTYPNLIKYAANATPMNALYNGYLNITVNNDILIPNWDVWKHYNTPETQETAAPGAGSPLDQVRGSFDGFYPVEPNIVLIGSKNNVVQITLPVGITSVTANSRVIIIARAITAQNSTVVS